MKSFAPEAADERRYESHGTHHPIPAEIQRSGALNLKFLRFA
jgi:hypothetical protein